MSVASFLKDDKKGRIVGFEHTKVSNLNGYKTKDGYLNKWSKKGPVGRWTKKWIVLTPDHAFYFNNKEGNLDGYLDMNRYESIVDETTKESKHSFIVTGNSTGMKPFIFDAENEQDKAEWISKFRESIKHGEKKSLERASSSVALRYHMSLYIRLAEARNLIAADIGNTSDPYCIVQLGAQSVRSTTVFKNRNPLWGEEHYIKIQNRNNDFNIADHVITVTVFDEDELTNDDILGAVDIPAKLLANQQPLEQWWPLKKRHREDFVQGEIRFEIEKTQKELKIKIVEARNLAAKDPNGFSDPFVKVEYAKESKKSEIIKKNLNPVWNYSCSFKSNPSVNEVKLVVKDWDLVGSPEFMGQVIVNLSRFQEGKKQTLWIPLQQKPHKPGKESDKNLGDIRLKLKYSEQLILPLFNYELLWALIDREGHSVISALGEVSTEKESLSQTLVHLFAGKGKPVELLNGLSKQEIIATPSVGVLFRGNSLATKSIDAFMKMIGRDFLRSVLKNKIREICSQKKNYEVDPNKADKHTNISENAKALTELVSSIFQTIVDSADSTPPDLKRVFSNLQKGVIAKWRKDPEGEETRYTSVSGFLFLRFWGPAILGPKLFGLVDEHPGPVPSRTLTLISKTIQTLGNLAQFGSKEPYMTFMNEFIKQKQPVLKEYIDRCSVLPPADAKSEPNHLVDIEAEFASLHNHLLREADKIRALPNQTPVMEKIPAVLSTLSAVEEKLKATSFSR